MTSEKAKRFEAFKNVMAKKGYMDFLAHYQGCVLSLQEITSAEALARFWVDAKICKSAEEITSALLKRHEENANIDRVYNYYNN